MSRLWTAKDVAEYLGVNIQTVWEWARRGEIPCYRIGDFYRFKEVEIDKWLLKKNVKSPFVTLNFTKP